jgi:hypothetical protein
MLGWHRIALGVITLLAANSPCPSADVIRDMFDYTFADVDPIKISERQ